MVYRVQLPTHLQAEAVQESPLTRAKHQIRRARLIREVLIRGLRSRPPVQTTSELLLIPVQTSSPKSEGFVSLSSRLDTCCKFCQQVSFLISALKPQRKLRIYFLLYKLFRCSAS